MSILAGMLVGIGDIIYIMSPNKIIGAMLFSLALLCIMKFNLRLYTGKIGKYYKYDFLDLAGMLSGNIIGCLTVVLIYCISSGDFTALLIKSLYAKIQYDMLSTFILAFLCGVLMYLTVESNDNIIVIFCITTFILSGFKHCIADVPLILLMTNPVVIVKYLLVIIGNSFGSILTHKLISEDIF